MTTQKINNFIANLDLPSTSTVEYQPAHTITNLIDGDEHVMTVNASIIVTSKEGDMTFYNL